MQWNIHVNARKICQWNVCVCCSHRKSSWQVHELVTTEINSGNERYVYRKIRKERKVEKCNKMSRQDNQQRDEVCFSKQWNKGTVDIEIKAGGVRANGTATEKENSNQRYMHRTMKWNERLLNCYDRVNTFRGAWKFIQNENDIKTLFMPRLECQGEFWCWHSRRPHMISRFQDISDSGKGVIQNRI